MKEHEQIWLNEVNSIIERELSNPDFTLEILAKELAISATPLYKKIVKLTGYSPKKYIRKKRLDKAKELLERGAYPTIKETVQAVGFKHAHYFSKMFEKEFSKKPYDYLK